MTSICRPTSWTPLQISLICTLVPAIASTNSRNWSIGKRFVTTWYSAPTRITSLVSCSTSYGTWASTTILPSSTPLITVTTWAIMGFGRKGYHPLKVPTTSHSLFVGPAWQTIVAELSRIRRCRWLISARPYLTFAVSTSLIECRDSRYGRGSPAQTTTKSEKSCLSIKRKRNLRDATHRRHRRLEARLQFSR